MEITIAETDRIAREELMEAIEEIQQPRSNFQIQNFVIGEKDTPIAAYVQCVLEMQIKHSVIRKATISRKKIQIEIQRLIATSDEIDALTAEEKQIDLDDLDLASTGALREFSCLYAIWKSFGRTYTYEEIQADQSQYWLKRLTRQASQDIESMGRIGQGNLDALRQAGISAQRANSFLVS